MTGNRVSWNGVPLEDRLWGRVEHTESGCWEFAGTRNGRMGYGNLYVDGTYRPAHRVAYELAKGPIPAGLVVMHRCDNPPCINPAHLVVGTVADNNADRARKGRNAAPPTTNLFASSKTHCPAGHPYEGENLRVRPNGHRYCATCARVHSEESRRRQGAVPRPTTHCKRGHEFTTENTRYKKTRGYMQRVCRTCANGSRS